MVVHRYAIILILDHQQFSGSFLEIDIFLLVFHQILHFLFHFQRFLTELFCGKVFKKFVVLSVILLPIKSSAPSADFRIVYFDTILSASVADSSVWSRRFWLYLPLEFLSRCLLIFLAKYKSPNLFTKIQSLGSVE